MGLSPKQFGQHQIVIKLDGQEVARTEFNSSHPFATDDPVLSFPKGSEPNPDLESTVTTSPLRKASVLRLPLCTAGLCEEK